MYNEIQDYLAYAKCKDSIKRAAQKGIEPQKIKKYIKLFALKWGDHRE